LLVKLLFVSHPVIARQTAGSCWDLHEKRLFTANDARVRTCSDARQDLVCPGKKGRLRHSQRCRAGGCEAHRALGNARRQRVGIIEALQSAHDSQRNPAIGQGLGVQQTLRAHLGAFPGAGPRAGLGLTKGGHGREYVRVGQPQISQRRASDSDALTRSLLVGRASQQASSSVTSSASHF